jgi:hypothetical protein
MSESDIALVARGGVNGMHLSPVAEAYGSNPIVAAPLGTAAAAPSVSLLHRVFSFPAMLGTFLVARVFYDARAFFVDPDLWWHIKTGQNIIATHHWPTTDPYSFTVAGQPWIACEWAGDVLLATVARFGGVLGLQALLMVLSCLVMLALYAFATLRSRNSKASFLASVVLCSLAFASFTLRPQMLGYLFLVLTLIALEGFRQGKHRAVWFLPVLLLLWINTHGSWIIGLGTIFVYWISGLKDFRLGNLEARRWTAAERKSISFVFLLCLAVLPLTPYGIACAAYPFEVASNLPLGVANVLEWQSMPFNIAGGKLFLSLLLSFIVLQVLFRFTWRAEELALFLFGTMMACLHVRFLLLFVPFFTPLFATILARWLPTYDRRKDRYVLNAVLMIAVVAAMVKYFPTRADIQHVVDQGFPVRAVEYLHQHHLPGPIFNNYAFGGYLVWSNDKVFVDGRSDPYERGGALADYLFISHVKPGALTVLKAYGVQTCLLERDEPLATLLSAVPEWQRVYADDKSVLFVKRSTAQSSVAEPGLRKPARKE